MITAKEEIREFLRSGMKGVAASSSRASLNRAAEQLFIANGKACPVYAVERDGTTYLIRRDAITNGS